MWREGDPETRQTGSATVPGSLEVDLAEGRWRVALAGAELFAEGSAEIDPESLDSDGTPTQIRLTVLPAARVIAQVLVPRGSTSPRSAKLRFEAPRGETISLEGAASRATESTCAISKQGRLFCKAPRGLFDLRLDFLDFAPVYRWGQRLETEVALGKIMLRPGASLSGWILAPDSQVDLGATQITLLAQVGEETEETVGDVRDLFHRTPVTVTESGFFQATGLRAGLFTLEASHPNYALTRLEGLALREGEETALDTLELQIPASVSVEIDPPGDPFHGHWRVAFISMASKELGEGVADADGLWRAESLTPGEYRLDIFDSRGSRWVSKEYALFPGANQLSPEVHFGRLEGLVLQDEEPLPNAEISFRESRGNMLGKAKTDAEGRFFVFLKDESLWNFEVVHRALHVQTRFQEVEVPPRAPADRWPKKVFEIPATRLWGDVFYRDGSKVEDPTVIQIASIDLDPSISLSKLKPFEGFEMRGLPAGRYRINASYDESSTRKRGESLPMEVSLEENTETGPLRLEIEPSRVLEGQVLSAAGTPLPAARIFAELEAPVGEWLTLALPSTSSDAAGVFQLDLPATARGVLVTVLAPGHAYHQERHSLTAQETPLVISLRTEQGVLSLVDADGFGGSAGAAPADGAEPGVSERRRRLFLLHETPMRHGLLALWSGMHPKTTGSAWTLPAMPPGAYRACSRIPEVEPLLATLTPLPGAWVEEFCSDEGYLSVGGHLELILPTAAGSFSDE